MPLFANKFHVKKAPVRRQDAVMAGYRSLNSSDTRQEFGPDISAITLDTGCGRICFDESTVRWVWSSLGQEMKGPTESSDKLVKVMSENRLLRLKIEILTDLVSNLVSKNILTRFSPISFRDT